MNLTKEQLLYILKKAYARGVWDHAEQKRVNMKDPYRILSIPDFIVEDLIEENTHA